MGIRLQISVVPRHYPDPHTVGNMLAERTRAELVQVIGRKIVLYKRNPDKTKIYFPGEKVKKN